MYITKTISARALYEAVGSRADDDIYSTTECFSYHLIDGIQHYASGVYFRHICESHTGVKSQGQCAGVVTRNVNVERCVQGRYQSHAVIR